KNLLFKSSQDFWPTLYMKERAYIQMALFLNGYRDEFIQKQFNQVFEKFDIPSLKLKVFKIKLSIKVLKTFFEVKTIN
ncbi:unnamed protein product, partial [Didymodactylos carnosus]